MSLEKTYHKPYTVGIVNAIKVASPPTRKIESLITHNISVSDAYTKHIIFICSYVFSCIIFPIKLVSFCAIHHCFPLCLRTFGRKTSLYTFLANMEEADSNEESADDITAADTAPSPKNDTYVGVKYCRTMVKIML